MPINNEESYQELDPESQKFTATVRENCGALLSRQWHYVLPFALIAYLLLQSLVTYFSVCTGSEPIQPWTQAVIVSIAGCFMLSVAYHAVIGFIMGAYSADSKELAYPRAVYTAAALISLVAGISACIKVNDNYRSICTDALGMQTFSSQWPEWLVDVPLLGYVTVAMEDKCELGREDKILITMMFSMIFIGKIEIYYPSSHIRRELHCYIHCQYKWMLIPTRILKSSSIHDKVFLSYLPLSTSNIFLSIISV